jgi:hypothetical protein
VLARIEAERGPVGAGSAAGGSELQFLNHRLDLVDEALAELREMLAELTELACQDGPVLRLVTD